MTKEQMLETILDAIVEANANRRIYGAVDHPDYLLRQIKQRYNISTGAFVECVDQLLRVGLVNTLKDDGGRVYALEAKRAR